MAAGVDSGVGAHNGSDMVRYAACGAVTGGAVTAAFWVPARGASWFIAVLVLIGFAVGAELGVAVGSGMVKRAWEGTVGSLVIPAVAIAVLHVIAFVVLGAESH